MNLIGSVPENRFRTYGASSPAQAKKHYVSPHQQTNVAHAPPQIDLFSVGLISDASGLKPFQTFKWGLRSGQGEPIGISELDELISEAQDLRERLVEKRPAELMAELEALGVSPPSLKRIRPPPRYKKAQGRPGPAVAAAQMAI